MKICILFICSIQLTIAANILAILPMASPSHHIWNSPLMIALANRGHNVTVVGPQAQKPPIPNLTDLVLTGAYQAEDDEEHDMDEVSQIHTIFMVDIFLDLLVEQCIRTQKHDAWTQLMNYPPETKFDLVIIESIGTECLLGALPRFGNPPIVSVIALSTPQWMFEISGTPNMISHIPHVFYAASDRMTFWQRLMNFFFYVYEYYAYHFRYLPSMDKVAREYYGPQIPSIQEILKKISLGMSNSHPVLDYSHALTPNLIPVAGIQIKDPKPLTPDLQNFLDNATEGAIFFCLGSNVKSEEISPQKKNAILQAFAELPQKVLWKFEADSLPGQPKNVKIGKWLPQTDILAHPNVKVFISHSGQLSTHEAIYRGVPVLGIPIFGDQLRNIQKVVEHGAGIYLNYKNLTKETLLKALNTLLHDASYRENMKELSAKFTDGPQTPLERAVFWTEYVLRHKGASHLQSAAKDLNFIQYFLLDVIAFILAIPILFTTVLYFVWCRRKTIKQTKKQIRKRKRN